MGGRAERSSSITGAECWQGEPNELSQTPAYLQVVVNELVGFKVIIILTKGVDDLFCHLQVVRQRFLPHSLPPKSGRALGPCLYGAGWHNHLKCPP